MPRSEVSLRWSTRLLCVLLVFAPLGLGGALPGARACIIAIALALPLLDRGRTWAWDGAVLAVLGLAGLGLVQVLPWPGDMPRVSFDPAVTIDAAVTLVAAGFVAAAAAQIRSRREARVLLRVIVLVAAVTALLGLLQQATWNGKILWVYAPRGWAGLGDLRASGPFVNPNHFAAFTSLGLFAALALAADALDSGSRRRETQLALLGGALGLLVTGLVASVSRAALASAVLGVAVLALLARRRGLALRAATRMRRDGAPLLLLAAIVLLLGLAILYVGAAGSGFLGRWLDLFGDEAPATRGRLSVWAGTLALVAEHPGLGVGLGCWSIAFPPHLSPPHHAYTWLHAHNDPLESIAEGGLLGAALWLSAGALWIGTVFRSSGARHTVSRAPRIPLGIGLGVFLLHSTTEFPFRMPALLVSFAAVAGLCLARRERASVPRRAALWRRVALVTASVVGIAWTLSGVVPSLRPARMGLERADGLIAQGWAEMPGLVVGGSATAQQAARAREHFERAARLAPARHEARLGLALTEPDPARALEELEAAVRLHPTHAPYRDQLALLAIGLGRRGEALAQIEEAVYFQPELGAHRYLSPGHVPGLDADIALAVTRGLTRALEDWAHRGETGLELARFHELRGEHAAAADLRLRLVEAVDLPPEAALGAMRALRRAGRRERAVALERDWFVGAEHAAASLALARQVYLPLGLEQEALEVIIAAGKQFGPDVELSKLEGRIRLARAEPAAVEVLRGAVARDPFDAEAYGLLGAALARHGRLGEALRQLERALELGGHDGFTLREIGMVLERRGAIEQSLARYREARAAGTPDLRWVNKRIFRLEQHLSGQRPELQPLAEIAAPCSGLISPCSG